MGPGSKGTIREHQLAIMLEGSTYTDQFNELLQPFYLNIP
jgi:hypothetical protein